MSWSYYKSLLCGRVGHKPPVRLKQQGNENCDCCDHSYMGCPRCRQNLEWLDQTPGGQ